uniref:Integrase catalytic domain-containing protein n=1 Tax=Fagus sylvatica TaxID=28930 RepID=A0A2N9ITG6_FAGSY
MVALERKFDELLSFVQLIAKRNPDDENQRKEDDKDTSEGEPEGHSNTNATPPPPTLPKPEGKDSQLDSKIDSLEEKIKLMQGLNSFGNTDFSSMSWETRTSHVLVPQHDDATQIPSWLNTGFNSQIAPDRFDLQRMEKKSNETFREYAQRWREKAARARPPLDEREMIKIFVDTLKNPYFDRMIGLQMQFFVDLIPVGERIEDALKTKEDSGHDGSDGIGRASRQEGSDEEKGRGCANDREKQWKTEASCLEKSQGEFTPLPMPLIELYPILIEKNPNLTHLSQGLTTAHREGTFNQNLTCDFHFGEVGTCDRELQPSETSDSRPNRPWNLERRKATSPAEPVIVYRGGVYSIPWRDKDTSPRWRHLRDHQQGTHVNITQGARGHNLECCEEFKKKVTDLMEKGLVGREEIPSGENHQPDDPSDFDWYAELNLDDIVEDEMDIDNLQNEGDDWGYFMEDDTDEWRNVDFTKLFQFPCLDSATWMEEPYVIPDLGVNEVIVETKEESSMSSLPALTERDEEEKAKPLPAKDPDSTAIAEEGEEPIKTPPVKSPSNIITTTARNWRSSNLADEGEEPREVKIGTRCTTEQKEALIALLREFHEIFAWSYQDMPGLDTDIVVHKIPLKPECKPVKQALRRMKPEVILKIKEEVEKQLKAGFLSTVTYSDWVANIVPVPKKDGKVRMCVDYRDLNRASPKGQLFLYLTLTPWSTIQQQMPCSHSWTDSQGTIRSKWPKKTNPRLLSSHTWGTFVYDVMPFGLKNAGATYQRAMRLKKYQLRLNPNKCAFGVTSGKLLGFIVSGRGIEIDPAKVQAIRSMPAPKTEKEIRSFLGRINYIARFIAQLTATCEPLFKLLRKDSKKHPWAACWDNKTRLGRKEQAIYYLSKKFTEPETRYLYLRMDPIKYIFEKPALTGKIARWQVLLFEFDILFVARKTIKGQAIADYLADYPSEQLELMDSEFPDEDVMTVDEDNHGRWKLYFDGAANAVGSGIGAVLVSPKGQQTPIAVKLGFDCTNNMTEYEACIVGLQAALEFGAYELEVFGDSLLIVSQTNGEWQARDPKLIPSHNHFADALATLASLIKLVEGDDVRPLWIETRDIPAYCVCVEECMNVEAEIDNKPWYYDIKRFIQDREYPPRATENEKKYIRRMAFQFFLSGEILYKRTHDATLLRCVDAEEANRLIQEMHAGLMGAHANGPFLARKIMRAGYYWLTMERDCIRHVQTCHKCQMYQNSKNAPPQYLHTMASPWPFSAWGMDVIGAITPKASNGHEFILVAIDYFTKWVEACSFKNVTQVAVTRFVKNNIICRYGMPEMLITDNASNLNNRMMDQLCQQFKIQHHNSAPYPSEDERSRGSCQQKLLPVEVEIPSLRILSQTQLEEAEWAQARYEQLNFIDEKRLAALCHGQLYQRRIERAYNKKARPRTFQPRRSRSEEEEYGPIRSTRKVRTII